MGTVATGWKETYSAVRCPHARVAIQCRASLDRLRVAFGWPLRHRRTARVSLAVPHSPCCRASDGNAGDGGAALASVVSGDIKTRCSWALRGGKMRSQRLEAGQSSDVQVGGWRRANNDVSAARPFRIESEMQSSRASHSPCCSDVLAAYVIRATPRPQIRPPRPLPTLAFALYANHRALAGRRGTTHAATLSDLLGAKAWGCI